MSSTFLGHRKIFLDFMFEEMLGCRWVTDLLSMMGPSFGLQGRAVTEDKSLLKLF